MLPGAPRSHEPGFEAKSSLEQPAKAANNPLVREGSEIVPNVTHVFSSNQHLFMYYEVYDPAKPEDAAEPFGLAAGLGVAIRPYSHVRRAGDA